MDYSKVCSVTQRRCDVLHNDDIQRYTPTVNNNG
jgi:hypothetical protein